MTARFIPETTLDGATTSLTSGPIPMHPDAARSFSVHQYWNQGGGSLAATVAVQVSNDPRVQEDINNGTSTASWPTEITSSISTLVNPSTGAGANVFNFSFGGYKYFRLVVTRSSGTGTYYADVNFNG